MITNFFFVQICNMLQFFFCLTYTCLPHVEQSLHLFLILSFRSITQYVSLPCFYLHMFITHLLTHVFHTCYLHVYLLLIYYMPCKHGLLVTIFPTLFLSYVIVYLHFFGHLFFILVLLIYDYSSTVCLLKRLFMHCPCAYSCAYSCTACLLMHSLTVQYIRTEWTLLFCS